MSLWSTLSILERKNPVADVGNVKTIDGKDGVYTVETKVDGYHIQKEGDEKAVDLVSTRLTKAGM